MTKHELFEDIHAADCLTARAEEKKHELELFLDELKQYCQLEQWVSSLMMGISSADDIRYAAENTVYSRLIEIIERRRVY